MRSRHQKANRHILEKKSLHLASVSKKESLRPAGTELVAGCKQDATGSTSRSRIRDIVVFFSTMPLRDKISLDFGRNRDVHLGPCKVTGRGKIWCLVIVT